MPEKIAIIGSRPEVRCYCGGPMEARPSTFHVGRIYYACTRGNCDGIVGAHPDGTPVGKPANKATRQARIRAHAAFDPIWKSGEMKRTAAYAWLVEATGVRHIGEASIEDCERVVAACEEYLGKPIDARDHEGKPVDWRSK